MDQSKTLAALTHLLQPPLQLIAALLQQALPLRIEVQCLTPVTPIGDVSQRGFEIPDLACKSGRQRPVLRMPMQFRGDFTEYTEGFLMIGSFIGWQPVCFVFLLAPLCGVVCGLAVKLLTGRTFIAFGPYLALATVAVLFSWRWLWEPAREIFGHPFSLMLLAGISLGGLILLLGLLRLYRAIPVDRRRT